MRTNIVTASGLLALSIGTLACAPSEPHNADMVTRSFTEVGRTVSVLATPSAEEADMVEDSDQQMEEETKSTFGESQESIVRDPECVSVEWAEWAATVRFDDCLLASGEPLDGSIGLSLSWIPFGVRLDFGDLVVAQASFDGSIVVSTGTELVISADLDLADEDTSVRLDQLTLATQVERTAINGSGFVDDPALSTGLTFSGVTWQHPECLPSSGTLNYDDGGLDVTITFLPTTPTDGVVGVSWLNIYQEQALLDPCG